MIHRIENERLIIEVNETGAELYSLKSKKTGTEYLWQGNPEYWEGRSPILFPICGRLFGGRYVYEDKTYEMPIHGIVKTAEFTVQNISDKEIDFTLVSDTSTKKQYPFDFKFIIKYALKDNGLGITYIVKNDGEKEMPFSFGAHPAFNVPFSNKERFEDYYIEFKQDELERKIFSDKCFDTGKTESYALKGKKLWLKHNLFDNDALFFTTETDSVKLKSNKSENYVEISYKDMTSLGLWHMPKTDAQYVCIEPWHGVPSDEGKVDNLDTKHQMIRLSPKKTSNNSYIIKIAEK